MLGFPMRNVGMQSRGRGECSVTCYAHSLAQLAYLLLHNATSLSSKHAMCCIMQHYGYRWCQNGTMLMGDQRG